MRPGPASSTCLPDLALDAIAAGEAPSAESAIHLDGCGVCRDRLRLIRKNLEFLDRLVTGIAEPDSASRPIAAARPGPRAWALRIPGYDVQEEISRGGQGVVFRAVQTSTKRTVALKIPLAGALLDRASARRFENECMLVAHLRHPYIVTVHESGVTPDGHLFVAMEMVAGKKLDEWSRGASHGTNQPSAVGIRKKLDLVAKVCDAVQYAHHRGIMHRDLKPGNIMVDAEGHPRLLDFGIARTLQRESHNTFTGQVVGTPAYASPEQVSGDPDAVDQRTDVYSLGVILYELVTGEYPYAVRGTLQQVVHHIQETPPARPSGPRAAEVDDDLWTIVATTLAKDRERRYQSAGAMAADLRHYLAGEAIDARRDSTLYVLRKTMVKHRRFVMLMAAGAMIVMAALGGAAAAWQARERETEERIRATSESQRAGLTSALLMKTLPPPKMDPTSPVARYATEGVDIMLGRLELGLVADRPDLEATWQRIMGDVTAQLESPGWAEISRRQALIRSRDEHGEEHWSVAQASHDLAAVLLMRGHAANAETYARHALNTRARLFGAKSPEVAETQDLLAQIKLAGGDLHEAERLVASSLVILRDARPDDDPAIAQSLDTRAALMLKLGRPSEARRDAFAALAARLSRQDDDGPEVTQSLDRLAQVAELPERLPELAPIGRALGVTPPSALAPRLRNLARALHRLPDANGKITPFSVALRDVLALKRELLGPDHRAVGHTLALLAWCLEGLDHNPVEAARCYKLAAPMIERELGPDHIALANCFQALSGCQRNLGDFADAAENARRCFLIWNRQPPDATDRLQVVLSHINYALMLDLAGRYQEAEQEYRACLDEAMHTVGPKHVAYARVQSELGRTLMHLGRLDEAEGIARQGLEILTSNPTGGANATPSAQGYLGTVLTRRGKFDEAEPLLLGGWERFCSPGPLPADYWVLRQEIVGGFVAVYEYRGDEAAASLWREKLNQHAPPWP